MLLLGLLIAIVSCSPVRRIEKGRFLLNRNTVKIDNSELGAALKPILKQKPNRRILGLFRFHLGVYTIANKGKETRFKNWVKRTIGEEPVLLDTILTKKSAQQLKQFLQNEGYFNAIVKDSTIYKKSRRAEVIYTVATGLPYSIRNISHQIADPAVAELILRDTANSLLKSGRTFSTNALKEERTRITKYLRNNGYYEFNDFYVSYDVDSTLNCRKADITLLISNPTDKNELGENYTLPAHRVFLIRDIIVNTEYDPLSVKSDTLTDTLSHDNFLFISKGERLRYKPDALIYRMFLEKNDVYKQDNSDLTYRGLSDLGLFRFINIKFEPEKSSDSSGVNWVTANIQLNPSPKQDYKIELEGTNNGGNFGIGTNFSYRNKNLFRGAEAFELRINAKAESVPNFVDQVTGQEKALLLNTYEIGPEVNFRIPRFIGPAKSYNRNRASNPATLFSISYNYQERPEYKRNALILSTGIEFRETKYKKHFVYPAEIKFSNFNLSSSFEKQLDETGDPKLINYYRKYIIAGSRYTFVYNTQEQNKYHNFIFLRCNFEIAGNSLRLYNMLSSSDYSDTSVYSFTGIEYSQYIRPEFEFRFYQVFSENSSLVYRINAGAGFSYLNSSQMPYEKTFSAGGVNDIRAFRARTIGPGSFVRTPDLPAEQLGDMKVNANIEYRFDIFRILEGAFFMDTGNIWNIRESEKQPGGQLKANEFLNEFAIGTGVGMRFDFTFFIFRLDAGVPVRNPALPEPDRWVINKVRFNNVNYNFGIGYPF